MAPFSFFVQYPKKPTTYRQPDGVCSPQERNFEAVRKGVTAKIRNFLGRTDHLLIGEMHQKLKVFFTGPESTRFTD